MMLGYDGIEDVAASAFECSQRTRLVLLKQMAVPDHVSGEDRGEATLCAFFGHWHDCHQRTLCA